KTVYSPFSLHDALPISVALSTDMKVPAVLGKPPGVFFRASPHGFPLKNATRDTKLASNRGGRRQAGDPIVPVVTLEELEIGSPADRKSTRLNSSHVAIS